MRNCDYCFFIKELFLLPSLAVYVRSIELLTAWHNFVYLLFSVKNIQQRFNNVLAQQKKKDKQQQAKAKRQANKKKRQEAKRLTKEKRLAEKQVLADQKLAEQKRLVAEQQKTIEQQKLAEKANLAQLKIAEVKVVNATQKKPAGKHWVYHEKYTIIRVTLYLFFWPFDAFHLLVTTSLGWR